MVWRGGGVQGVFVVGFFCGFSLVRASALSRAASGLRWKERKHLFYTSTNLPFYAPSKALEQVNQRRMQLPCYLLITLTNTFLPAVLLQLTSKTERISWVLKEEFKLYCQVPYPESRKKDTVCRPPNFLLICLTAFLIFCLEGEEKRFLLGMFSWLRRMCCVHFLPHISLTSVPIEHINMYFAYINRTF